MKIQTGTQSLALRRPPAKPTSDAPQPEAPQPEAPPAEAPAARRDRWLPPGFDWREVTLNEAAVEIPQAVLELSSLREANPVVGGAAQAGVASLAFLRGYQGLTGSSLEQKLEGASSLALGVAGTLSLLPGQMAANASSVFLFGQAALELTLGLRELHEELVKDETPDWKEITTGSLDTLKGASAFVPLFVPAASDVVNGIQIATLLGKAVLESTIRRSTDE